MSSTALLNSWQAAWTAVSLVAVAEHFGHGQLWRVIADVLSPTWACVVGQHYRSHCSIAGKA